MARRLTLGLRYRHKDEWVGGVYYVRNLVQALGRLPKPVRPRLVIVGADKAALSDLREATGYQDLHRISRTRIHQVPAPRVELPWARRSDDEIDVILMGSPPGLEDRGVQWIPDFQEHRFPEFFPPEELAARLQRNTEWLTRHRHVMVSSHDVAQDVERHYGVHANQVHVVRFASFVDRELRGVDLAGAPGRHGLEGPYFICNNQLWRHKNHGVILRALAELEPDEEAPPVVLTGREEDYRDPAYAPGLKALAAELGVERRLRFLGFLPRGEQLALMSQAIAVIQPSLCEGWSTVIEDARALGRPVFASDIAVNREQLQDKAAYFAPDDHQALAALLRASRDHPPTPLADAEAARERFTRELWAMIQEVETDLRRRRVDRLDFSS